MTSAVTELEMGVIRFDAHFGAAILRPATGRWSGTRSVQALARRYSWDWVAGGTGGRVGLVARSPAAGRAGWIAG